MIPVLTQDENIEELIQNHSFVILQFGTETCLPCHALSRKLADWGNTHPAALLRYVPLETHTKEAAQMGIYSAPTIYTYVEGKCYQQESGAFSMEELLAKYGRVMELVGDS